MSELEERHYLQNGGEVAPDAHEALEWASETRAAMVDLKFCDLLGTWQHVSLPVRAFDEGAFDEGLGFDGSSIRGWQAIQDSDMLLMPDASSAILDPATEVPTLSLVCEIADPVTREPYAKDPRGVARRAEAHLRASGIADTAHFGPECEFFVFEEVHYDLAPNRSHYLVDSAEGYGTPGSPGSAIPPGPRRATSPLRRPTRSTTYAARWCSRSSASASLASSTITRSPRAVSARSTCATRRSRAWPIRS
jgi:hypothetical protein